MEEQHWAAEISTDWLLEEVQRRIGIGERARAEALGLWGVIEVVREYPYRPKLREIADELKRLDGEHWAVGEMLERACIFLDAFYAVAPPQEEAANPASPPEEEVLE